MKAGLHSSTLALAVAVGWAVPAQAQSADSAAIQQELARMREQMARMAERIDTLESQLAAARASAAAANEAASNAVAVATEVKDNPPVKVAWKGAPEIQGKGGWSFKPRGRVQVDVGGVDAPNGLAGGANDRLGVSSEFRRAYIGFDGTMPGGFGYRVEADLANSDVQLTDLFLTYQASKELTLTVGQHKSFWGLEELSSDLYTSMMERAAFSSAFGFERRVGASATYTGKSFIAQGGVFTDDAASLNNDRNKNYSVDGRLVAMPKLAGGTLHLGVSAHFRDLGGSVTSTQYRARPFVHTTEVRLVDTGNVSATSERGLGAELAYVSGRFHATAESHWLTARRPGLPDPTFNGGYAEVGYLLTNDKTAYKNGNYDRIRPASPVSDGGIGAIQVNARYDWLDLTDAGIVGGRQQTAGLSVIWMPTDYVRFIANYGHIWINDAAVPAGTDRNYSVDAMGMRAQFDF